MQPATRNAHPADAHAPPSRLKAAVFAFVTALALGVLPLAYWFNRSERVDRELSHQIEHSVDEVSSHLLLKLKAIELVLRGVRGFVEGSDVVTADEFHAFVAALQIDQTASGLLSVSFVPAVSDADLERFLADVGPTKGAVAFQMRPPGHREVYAPVLFVEPAQPHNTAIIGLDVLTLPVAREAALRARESAGVSLSRRLSTADYVGDLGDGATAFVMYLPIFKGTPLKSPFLGWAGARFRFQDIVQKQGQLLHPGLHLQVFEGDQQTPESLLFGLLDAAPAAFAPRAAAPHVVEGQLAFGGQHWTYTVMPTAHYLATHQDRLHHWLATLGMLLSLAAGLIVWLLMTARDRAQQAAMAMTAELRALSSDLEGTLSAVPDLLFELDAQGRYVSLRTSTEQGLVMPREAVIGKTVHEVLTKPAADTCMSALEEASRSGLSVGRQIEIVIAGESRWFELSIARKPVDAGMTPRFVMLSRDITERRAAEQRMHELAFFDHLTRLPNRSQFMLSASHRLAEQHSGQPLGAAILIDLDNFKVVNDHWGHHRGDQMLIEIARRVREELAPHDTLARLGGDEFIVLLQDLGSDETLAIQRAEAVCGRLLASVSRPMLIDGREYFSSASLGVVMLGQRPMLVEELLSQTDSAMYFAKDSGRNTYRFFDGRLQARIAERIDLEADLRQSIERKELFLLYQPQVDQRGRVIGAEALCRWRNATRGLVSPGEFVPLAESSGFIRELGPWVLETACKYLATWRTLAHMDALTLSVNVSARQFHHPDFVRQVQDALRRTGANPALLKLELTESIFAEDLDEIVSKMDALRAQGIRFSLDDFGTGYSSLSYLKKLPLDQLKIDQSFVRDVLSDSNDEAIIRTVIALGQSLGLNVIAEGVENEQQRASLLRSGCVLYQGYLFGRPMDEVALTGFVAGSPA